MSPSSSSLVPPQGVRDAAKRGLKWYEEGHGGDGLTDGAVQRARSLARGENQTPRQIKRMRSFFARHEVDKSSKSWREGTPAKPSPSQVAWALWGGDAGMSWSNSEAEKMNKKRLVEAERDLLMEKLGRLDIQLAEAVWSGSMGGHDPEFNKLKGGLKRFWIEKAATSPHPFAYCVRHLRKHVANPERLCAWLKDQALGTTKWRHGNKMTESGAEWEPGIDELRSAIMAYEEAAQELGVMVEGDDSSGEAAAADAPNEGGSASDGGQDGAAPESEGSEAGDEGAEAAGGASEEAEEGSEQPAEE